MPIDESVFERFPTLQTERLTLDSFEPNDAADVFRFYSSAESLRYVPRNAFDDPRQGEDKVRSFVDAFGDRSAIWWAFRLRATGDFVGYGGLFAISSEDHHAEVGYGFHPEFWGRGFASEAVGRIVEHGFSRLRLHRIYGLVDPDNGASLQVLAKLGFAREGVLRDAAFARGRYWTQCVLARVAG